MHSKKMMKTAFKSLFKSALTALLVLGASVSAKAISLPTSPLQDGPNCFNTTLLALGYADKAVYISDQEIEFYLKNFCTAVKDQAPANVITFSKNQSLVHSAFMLENGLIIEKNSLYGALAPTLEYDPAPGRYLTHAETESLFHPKNSLKIFGESYLRKAYQCLPAAEALKKISSFQHPAILEQIRYKEFIAKFIYTKDRKVIEQQLKSKILPQMKLMTWDQFYKKQALDKKSKELLIGLLRSNAYQTHLLLCSESQRIFDECYTPELTDVKQAIDQWFEKIYEIEN